MAIELLEFSSRGEASDKAAQLVAGSIHDALANSGNATVVVSGGSTPGPCFNALSAIKMDWAKVRFVPSDERWVEPKDPNSNEHLVRSQLLINEASAAGFIPLYRPGVDIDAAPAQIEADLPKRFSCSLLGMGADGHFASLFPDFNGLSEALNPVSDTRCVAVQTDSSPYPRISLTLAALLSSEQLYLLFFGHDKRAVFDQSLAGEPDYPISFLLPQRGMSLTALWAP